MKAFLDIETGGFSMTKNGICDIAITVVDHNLEVVETFHEYIKPYPREDSDELVSYKDDAMAINGLSIEFLTENGKQVECVMFAVIEFIVKHGISEFIGHNSKKFDIPRVLYLIDRFVGVNKIPHTIRHDDTMEIAKKKLSLSSYSLPALCEYFGIPYINAHTSSGDALLTLQVYKKLVEL